MCVGPKQVSLEPEASSASGVGRGQRRALHLSYAVSLLFFGFLSPLCALCWLYLRMYSNRRLFSNLTSLQLDLTLPSPQLT